MLSSRFEIIQKVGELQEADGYWRVRYYRRDERKRKFKRFGAVAKKSKRQAQRELSDWLHEVGFFADPDGREVPTLGQFLERFIENQKAVLAGSTVNAYERLVRYLNLFFGKNTRLDEIPPAAAADFRTALMNGKLIGGWKCGKSVRGTIKSENSIRHYLISSKAIFNAAIKEEWIVRNPFGHLCTRLAPQKQSWRFVCLDEFRKALTGCRSLDWKLFLALQRMAGLRFSEALHLELVDIDFEQETISVFCSKTARASGVSNRLVPIVYDDLKALLLEAKQAAASGQKLVLSEEFTSRKKCNNRRDLDRILEWVGLAPWRPPFQILRRSCETEWANLGVP